MPTRIVTERLILRSLVPGDAPAIHAYRSDPEVSRYQCWRPESLDEVRSFVARQAVMEADVPDTWLQLAITLAATGELIGDLGLHTLEADGRQAEFGITLAPDHQGRGHATEAVVGALGFLFDHLGKHRVIGSVDPRNTASISLMRRVGMRQEAHLVESLWAGGEWVDDLIFAMLEREWRRRAESVPRG